MGKKKQRNKDKKNLAKFSPKKDKDFSDVLPEPEDFPPIPTDLGPDGGSVRFVSYNITTEPMDWGYPVEIKKYLAELYDQIPTQPQVVIPKLLELKDKYPNVPCIYNYLATAYQTIGDQENAEFWTRENYRICPNYLFARINAAQLCLNNKQFDEFEKIFDHKLELTMLYPERDTFHISEVIHFYTLMLDFCLLKAMIQPAQVIYKMLKKLIPDSPKLARVKPILQAGLLLLSTEFLAKGKRNFLQPLTGPDKDHQ